MAPFRTRRIRASVIFFFKVQTHCYEAVDLDDLIRVRIFSCRVTDITLDDDSAIAFQRVQVPHRGCAPRT